MVKIKSELFSTKLLKFQKRFNRFLFSLAFVFIIISPFISYYIFNENLTSHIDIAANDLQKTVAYIYGDDGIRGVQKYLNYLGSEERGFNLVIVIADEASKVIASNEDDLIGLNVKNFPRKNINDFSSKIEIDSTSIDISRFALLFPLGKNHVLIQMKSKNFIRNIILTSFGVSLITIVFIFLILFLPLMFFNKYFLIPLHQLIQESYASSSVNISRFFPQKESFDPNLKQPFYSSLTRFIKSDLAKIEKNEVWLLNILERLPVGLILADSLGKCAYMNEKIISLLNLSEDEKEKNNWLSALCEGDKERVTSEWNACVRKQKEFKTRFKLAEKEGQQSELEGKSVKMLDLEGHTIGFIVVFLERSC